MKRALNYTFSDTLDNYGQVLQYLAIQEFYKKFGIECWLLRYSPKKHKAPFSYRVYWKLRAILSRTIKLIFQRKGTNSNWVYQSKSAKPSDIDKQQEFFKKALEITIRDEKLHPRHFEEFRRKYFHILEVTRIEDIPQNFDIYSVGSDQIWGNNWSINYLGFLSRDNSAVRLSIAPSFGAWRIKNREDVDMIKNVLSTFDIISVREKSGLDICFKAGRNDAFLVLDPTLYISANDYSKFEEPIDVHSKYLLVYLLGNPCDLNVDDVMHFAKEENLNVVYITSQGREDRYSKTYATVGQWLSYIKNAQYIFTNSFHGVAFSIIYRKQFLVSKLVQPFTGMNDRIDSLLIKLNLSNRIIENGELGKVKDLISYDEVYLLMKKETQLIFNRMTELFERKECCQRA